LLLVRHLSQKIAGRYLLEDVNFEAKSSSMTVLLGPNGAGKTTLLKTIVGLLSLSCKDKQSKIMFQGKNISLLPVHRRVSLGLVYLPQQTSLFQSLTVEDNLQIIYEYQDYWREKSKDVFLKERDELLKKMAIFDTLKRRSGVLSGGQKRKVEIARSLLMHPLTMLLDEPFAGVDPKSIYELRVVLREIVQKGISVVVSDHNVNHLLSIGENVFLLIAGRVVFSGTPKQVLECSFAREHYFGNQFYQDFMG
jgi:lipopolysaccharide export system ATP-binding protein